MDVEGEVMTYLSGCEDRHKTDYGLLVTRRHLVTSQIYKLGVSYYCVSSLFSWVCYF